MAFESRNEDRGMGPGILNAFLAFCQIVDDGEDGAGKAEQVEAQFDKLVRAQMKAGDQYIEDGTHNQQTA